MLSNHCQDLSEAALPMTTDDTASVRGGKRFEQIGCSAALKLLESVLDGELPAGISAVVVVDTALNVGDFFFAWLERVKALKFPVFFVGATADRTTLEWFFHHSQEELCEKILSGQLQLPGYQGRPKTPPADVLAAPPTKPSLNVCTVRSGPTIAVPQHLVDEWGQHPVHSEEFCAKLKAIVEEFGEPSAETGSEVVAPESEVPSAKRRRMSEPVQTMDASEVPQTKLAEAALQNLKKDLSGKVLLRIDATQSWYITNNAGTEAKLAAGMVVAGFGPGGFQHQPRNGQEVAAVDQDKLVLFDLTSAEFVLHNGKLESLGEILQARETEKGKAAVCYHEVAVKAGEALGQYQITRKHEVYFKPNAKVLAEEDGTELKLQTGTSSFAALVPFTGFQKFQHVRVLWAVKWTLKGLMPVKPVVCLHAEVLLPPGKAMKL